MKRVRVLVVFEEVNDKGEVVKPTPTGPAVKFGSLTNEHYGPPEYIALKVGELVTETISRHFPPYLESK
jgi:hypothetical protein